MFFCLLHFLNQVILTEFIHEIDKIFAGVRTLTLRFFNAHGMRYSYAMFTLDVCLCICANINVNITVKV